MSAEFDKEAKQEYLDAIRFYGKAAERFSEALAACLQNIQCAICGADGTRGYSPGAGLCQGMEFARHSLGSFQSRRSRRTFRSCFQYPRVGQGRDGFPCGSRWPLPGWRHIAGTRKFGLSPGKLFKVSGDFAVGGGTPYRRYKFSARFGDSPK
jgi:hypothetical protein